MNSIYKLNVCCTNCGGTFQTELKSRDGISSDEEIYNECSKCACASKLPVGKLSDLLANEPPDSSPRALDYVSARPYFDHARMRLFEKVTVFELRAPTVAFNNSLARLHSLLEIPSMMAWLGRLFQTCKHRALAEVVNDFDGQARNSEEAQKINQLVVSKFEQWFKDTPKEDRLAFARKYGDAAVRDLTGAPIWNGLEAVLVAQITGLWTTFETLAGDLWEGAVNAHPFGLAELKGRTDSKKAIKETPPPPDQIEKKDSDERYLLVSSLQEARYDLSHYMGTALRHRCTFTKLEGIRDAYCKAFFKNKKGITGALENSALDHLSALRNVMVHRGGYVDKDFKKKAARFKRYSTLNLKERVPITGPLIQEVGKEVVTACVQLITAVNDWIVEERAKDST